MEMHRNRSHIIMICAGAFLITSIIGTGCASGPKYGAARKSRKKGCDCPHWNAVPKQGVRDGIWSMNANPSATDGDGAIN